MLSTGLSRFADGAFDVVLASNVIEHFEPEAAAGIVERDRPRCCAAADA